MHLTESSDLLVRIYLLCLGESTVSIAREHSLWLPAATLWNSLNVRDRGNRVRGSRSLENSRKISRFSILMGISNVVFLYTNIIIFVHYCTLIFRFQRLFNNVLSIFYYFTVYHSSALQHIIERYISIVYYFYYLFHIR